MSAARAAAKEFGTTASLTGLRRAATLLVVLGPEVSAQILRNLPDVDVERLALEISQVGMIDTDLRDDIVQTAYLDSVGRDEKIAGGLEYSQELLRRALGDQRAEQIMGKISVSLSGRPRPFDFIRDIDLEQFVQMIQGEHPQAIALILSYQDPDTAASILSLLGPDLQADVAIRIADMERTSPEVIDKVEKALRGKLSFAVGQDRSEVGGTGYLVRVLNNADRSTEKAILEAFDSYDPDLAGEIRKLLFTFEDISKLDDRSLQRILREVDNKDLALALKGAGEEFKQKIFKNQSTRAADMLKEEINMLGPLRLRTIEEAQQRIVNVARRLEESEEIVIIRGNEDILV
ncbi:MAG: flagellar motor switch protein FliG [Chloroflexota bacterium]|nr:MAG: flagellar motor switch protein FliG [Chloroflexota bacterium]